MKKLNYIFIGLLFFSAICISGCSSQGSDSENENDTTIVQMEQKMDELESTDSTKAVNENSTLGKEYTAKYICPDHCKGSGSDKPGECPNCGMELMENPAYGKE